MYKPTPLWRRRKTWLVILIVVIAPFAVPASVWLFTLIDPAPAQDNCTFNSVSNAEYRSLLARARNQHWTVWPDLSNGLFIPSNLETSPAPPHDVATNAKLLAAIADLTTGSDSRDVQLAASHAVMRSMGAEFVSADEIPDFPQPASPRSTTAGFLYFMPQIRFAPLCLPCLFFWNTTLQVDFHHDLIADTYRLAYVNVLNSEFKYMPTRPAKPSGSCPYFRAASR